MAIEYKEEINQEPLINVRSLRDIAIYLEGVKHGKGNILPLGTDDLNNLWVAISLINRNGLGGTNIAEVKSE